MSEAIEAGWIRWWVAADFFYQWWTHDGVYDMVQESSFIMVAGDGEYLSDWYDTEALCGL